MSKMISFTESKRTGKKTNKLLPSPASKFKVSNFLYLFEYLYFNLLFARSITY